MNLRGNILEAIEELANDFNGELTLKNRQRQYIYVNNGWIKLHGLSREQVLGKIDAEFFTPATSMQIMMADKKAIEKKLPDEYLIKFNTGHTTVVRVVTKWAVYHDSGELFCICTLSVKPENKRNIYDVRKKVEALFEKVI